MNRAITPAEVLPIVDKLTDVAVDALIATTNDILRGLPNSNSEKLVWFVDGKGHVKSVKNIVAKIFREAGWHVEIFTAALYISIPKEPKVETHSEGPFR